MGTFFVPDGAAAAQGGRGGKGGPHICDVGGGRRACASPRRMATAAASDGPGIGARMADTGAGCSWSLGAVMLGGPACCRGGPRPADTWDRSLRNTGARGGAENASRTEAAAAFYSWITLVWTLTLDSPFLTPHHNREASARPRQRGRKEPTNSPRRLLVSILSPPSDVYTSSAASAQH